MVYLKTKHIGGAGVEYAAVTSQVTSSQNHTNNNNNNKNNKNNTNNKNNKNNRNKDILKIHLKKILKAVRTNQHVELLPLNKSNLLFDNIPDPALTSNIAENKLNWNEWKHWENLFVKSNYNMPFGFSNASIIPSKTHNSIQHQLFNEKKEGNNYAYNHFKAVMEKVTGKYVDKLEIGASENQPNLEYAERKNINYGDKLFFVGDIHSAFHSLAYILFRFRTVNHIFVGDTMTLKPNHYIVFTGDFVDYGSYGIETLWCLLTLKDNNPEQVIIINGNHEEKMMYTKKSPPNGQKGSTLEEEMVVQVPSLKTAIDNFLALLPIVVFLKKPNGEYYQTNHGSFCEKFAGYNEETDKFDKERHLLNFLQSSDKIFPYLPFKKGQGKSYLWGDFIYDKDKPITSFKTIRGPPMYDPIARQKYSAAFTKRYCDEHNIISIISGHQDSLSIGIIPNINDIHTNPMSKISTDHEIDIGRGHTLKWYPADKYITYNWTETTLDDNAYDFELQPYNDVVAIILSTATTMIKKCMFHSVGELVIERKPSGKAPSVVEPEPESNWEWELLDNKTGPGSKKKKKGNKSKPRSKKPKRSKGTKLSKKKSKKHKKHKKSKKPKKSRVKREL